jgi:hypothetical protein
MDGWYLKECNMLTEKDYCDYETCVALKELGYVGSSRYYYTQQDRKFHYDAYNKFYTVRTADAMGYVLAIHLYEAQKWLREEKNNIVYLEKNYFGWYYAIHYNVGEVHQLKFSDEYDSYEEALSAGIKEAIKLLKEK